MSELVSQTEPDRPAEKWKYAYLGGAVDLGSNFSITVGKDQSRKVGYAIAPSIDFSYPDPEVMAFLEWFLEDHGMEPVARESGNTMKLQVNKRDDVEHLLRLVQPYLIARDKEATILLKNLLPGLELGKQSSKKGFLDLVEYVDQIREKSGGKAQAKYDEAHFRDEWDM